MLSSIKKNTVTLLLIILSVATGFRYILLDQSFWLDEAAQAIESARPLSQQLDIFADFQPPLFHILVHFLTNISTSESFLRLASLIPGVLTVLLVFLISKMLFKRDGERIGILASLFLSLSSYHIYFSQELRPYALACFFGTLSWFLLLKMLENPKKYMWSVLYILSTTGGLYSMYVYPFLLLSQILYIFVEKKHIKHMLKLWSISFLTFVPWIPSFIKQFQVGSLLRTTLPGWEDVVSTPQWKAIPMVLMKFFSGVVPMSFSKETLIYVLFGFLLLAVIKVLFLHQVGVKKAVKDRGLIILCVWLCVSVVSAYVVSFMVPVLSPKRVLFAQPAFFMILSFVIVSLKRKLSLYVSLLVSLYLFIGVCWYWVFPQFQREFWRESIVQISQEYESSKTIAVFGYDEPFAPWNWYTKRYAITIKGLGVSRSDTQNQDSLQKKLSMCLNYETVLVFDYLRDLSDPQKSIEAWLEAHGYKGVKSLDTLNFGFIRVYQRGKSFAYQVE